MCLILSGNLKQNSVSNQSEAHLYQLWIPDAPNEWKMSKILFRWFFITIVLTIYHDPVK